jgi:hypothetical protein
MVLRMITLTPSVTPVITKAKKVSQKERDNPNRIVDNPNPNTAIRSTGPWRRIIFRKENIMAMMPAPNAGAAMSNP